MQSPITSTPAPQHRLISANTVFEAHDFGLAKVVDQSTWEHVGAQMSRTVHVKWNYRKGPSEPATFTITFGENDKPTDACVILQSNGQEIGFNPFFKISRDQRHPAPEGCIQK